MCGWTGLKSRFFSETWFAGFCISNSFTKQAFRSKNSDSNPMNERKVIQVFLNPEPIYPSASFLIWKFSVLTKVLKIKF